MTKPALEVTVEALAYQLRAGVAALEESSAQRRISELDEAQMLDIANRLTKERWGISENGKMPSRVPPWGQADIKHFIQMWKETHG